MSAPEVTPAAYTDADVQAAVAAARECLSAFDTVMNVRAESRYVATTILDAVAPAIAARAAANALREAAAAVSARTTAGNANIGPDGRRLERRAIATMLRARALSARVAGIEASR